MFYYQKDLTYIVRIFHHFQNFLLKFLIYLYLQLQILYLYPVPKTFLDHQLLFQGQNLFDSLLILFLYLLSYILMLLF